MRLPRARERRRERECVTEAETVGVKDNRRGRVRSEAGHRRYVEGDEE